MFSGSAFSQSGSTTVSPSSGGSVRLIAAVPMAFEENDGQLAPGLAYLGRAKSYSVAIERGGLRFLMSGSGSDSTIDVRFAGSRGGSPVALSAVAYRSNYFIGPDRSQWHEGVANFSRVGIRGIYPGIDTEFYDKDGELEHDFVLAPGADANTIRLDLESAQHAALNVQGEVIIPAGGGELRFRKPAAYQFDGEGRRIAVEASYRLEKNSLCFTLGSYDHSRTLVIDPVIVFATYISGTAGSTPAQLATDGHGTLFLVGSTTNVNGFPALPGTQKPTSILNGGSKDVFVASLSTGPLGSSLSWLTFLGNAGASAGLAIAYSGSTDSVYIGGTTSAGGFPGAPTAVPQHPTDAGSFGGIFSSVAGSVSGFVSSLSSTTGAGPVTTYISSSGASPAVMDTTTVTGLAADPRTGNVYISGYGLGVGLPSVNQLGPASGESSIVPANPGTTNNAFVIELDSNLDQQARLVTYVQSAAGGTPLDYRATAIQIDSAAVPNIYVAGQVFSSGPTITFPTAQAFTSAGVYNGDNFGNCGKTSPDPGVFLAQIVPPAGSDVNSTLGFSALSCGDGVDHANALALGSDLFLVGDTTSDDFAAKVMYSAGKNTSSASFPSTPAPLQPAMAGTNANGFAMSVSVSGGSIGVPSAFTYLGGSSGATILLGAAADGSNGGLLQLAGSTTAKRADMPGLGATPLPSGQDTSAGQAAGASRGLLYTLSADLTTAKSISYFGYASSNAKAVSAQADGAGDAFVLVDDNVTGATAPFSFINAAAIESTPAAADNAYVAEVQGTAVAATPAPGLVFTADSNSPQIDNVPCSSQLACEIAFNNGSDFSTVVYTWDLNLASAADNVVVNFPEQDLFLPSGTPPNPAYAIEADGGNTALTCLSRQNNNGTTCTFASPLNPGAHTVTLTATTGPNAQSMAGTSFQFDGNAADAEGEFSDAPQPAVKVANPVSITLAFTENGGAGPLTVNAAKDSAGTGGTTVVYQALVRNTSANDSPNTSLTISGLPPAAQFLIQSVTATGFASGTCDIIAGTGCSKFDLAAGGTLTYTITGIYLGPGFSSSTPGPYAFMLKASATALPLTTDNKTQNATPLVTNVNGSASLSISLPAPAYPSGQTYFSLSNTTPVAFKITVSNGGPNAAGSFSLTNTLPTGFTVTSTTCGTATCDNSGTGFTAASLASGGSLVYTVNGYFSDHGAAGGDAVPTNASKSTVTDSATITAQPGGTNDAALPVSAATPALNVQRSVHLKIAITTTGSLPSSKGYTNQPAFNMGTPISYTYTITNSGASSDFNVQLTNLFTTAIPANYVTVTPPAGGSISCPSGYSSCILSSIPGQVGSNPGSATFTFTVNYPDLAPPPATPPYQLPASFEAVPTGQTNAAYTYNGAMSNQYLYAVDIAPNAADNQSSLTVNVYRTAALSLSPSVTGFATTCASGSQCFYMANSSSTSDKATYTVAINNGGPNLATNTTLTIPLPTNFLVSADPTVSFNGLQTTTPANLNCAYQNTATTPNSVVCTGYVPQSGATVTVVSKFSTSTVPASASSVTVTAPSATSIGASAIDSNSTTSLPPVEVDRAANLVAVKVVNAAPGNVSPNGFAINGVPAVNLDEHVAGDANGKNDTVQITEEVGNAGLNDATGVVITDTLPPFFILTQKPSFCALPTNPVPARDGSGNYMTGATPVTMTCTLQNPVPQGTAQAGSGSKHGTVNGAFAQVVYYGKFEDNGLQTDAVPQNQSSTSVQFQSLSAKSADIVNLGLPSDLTSAAVPPTPVMRAAHLHFTLTQYVQPGDAALNPVGGVTGPGIAEAQLGANGGQVINPVRYQVKVTNDGPNSAPNPVVVTTLPLNPGGAATSFVHVAQSIEPAVQGFPVVPANCAAGQACQDAGLIATGASILYNVDGNFDLNTLTEGNSGARIFSSTVGSASVVDSNPTATTGGDQKTSLPITVVNTPAGANFTLAPFAASLTQPLNLKLGTVQIAGITGLVASGASPAPAVPMGPSPNPPDNGASVPLYRFGQGGVYYTLGTTAGVSTATTNSTQVCLTAIPDTFQKPERALLWVLANAPTGTAFNAVPHFTSTATMGDITTLVLPQGGGSYSVPAPVNDANPYPPPPAQPQPAEICGVLNGLADAAHPTVLAVLEPVNFAPFIRTAVTAANAQNSQPGKGVTAAAVQVDLSISPQNNYDYNDADPCYTGDGGTTRSSCNDNVQLTTFLFGGGNLIGNAQQVSMYTYNQVLAAPKPQFNLPAGQPQLYLVLADQLGAQGYKEMTSGGNTQVCDPGNPSTSYTPSTPSCPLPNPLNGASPAVPPLQTQLPLSGDTSVEVAQLIGNVGFGGSTGLIPLPQTPTPEATAHITAGQTAGFAWNWLTEQPSVQAAGNATPPTLTLTCTSADGSDLASKGIECQVQQTYTYSTGSGNSYVITAPPAIYVVTTSNTAVGALHAPPAPGAKTDLRMVAAIVFPIGAIPLVVLLRRRRALKLSGWLAIVFFVSLAGLSIGCGSSGFKNEGGTTTTATPAGTYQFIVTATGTDSNGNPINIKTYPFAVTVSPVQ